MKCRVCEKEILTEDDSHAAEIKRGYFEENTDGDIECNRVKCSIFICVDCYLTDPDLCQFFNKLDMRIR